MILLLENMFAIYDLDMSQVLQLFEVFCMGELKTHSEGKEIKYLITVDFKLNLS